MTAGLSIFNKRLFLVGSSIKSCFHHSRALVVTWELSGEKNITLNTISTEAILGAQDRKAPLA